MFGWSLECSHTQLGDQIRNTVHVSQNFIIVSPLPPGQSEIGYHYQLSNLCKYQIDKVGLIFQSSLAVD